MINSLLMPFIEQSEIYVHGFEAGMIWQILERGEQILGRIIHLENSAQIQMICDYYKVKCKITVQDDTYGFLTVEEGNK
jgi:hypothetical protein